MSVGSRIRERREALGITQPQLAEMIGVTKGAVGNYEAGANSPKVSTLYALFDVLKCDANYLFQDDIDNLKAKKAPPVSGEAMRVAVAFDAAEETKKEIVRLTLGVEKNCEKTG